MPPSLGYYLFKLLLTSLLVVGASELARRSTLAGGLLASLPLVSLLTLLWVYLESRSVERVALLCQNIFWLVLPSLLFFLLLPWLLRLGWGVSIAVLTALAATIASYGATLWWLHRAGGA